MSRTKLFSKAGHAGFVPGLMILAALTGCVGYVRGPRAEVYVAPPVVETSVVMADDYIYYPGYHAYYSSNRRQYLCLEHGAWVSRPAPRGVSINVLLSSPSVRMEFHDSPAHHHAEIARQYPKNWAPPGAHQGHQENRKDNQRDARGDNHGR